MTKEELKIKITEEVSVGVENWGVDLAVRSIMQAIDKYMKAQSPSLSSGVNGLVEALNKIVQEQRKQYQFQKDEADWYNNNMPGVGQNHDYKTYPSLPDWVTEIENIIAQYSTQSQRKVELEKLTDEDALEIFEISGGGSAMMKESKIFQVKDILTTNKFYNTQTNIPPIVWAKIFDFLIRRGYVLPKGLLSQSLPESQESKEGEEWKEIQGKRYLLVNDKVFQALQFDQWNDGDFEADAVNGGFRVLISKNASGYFVANAMDEGGNNCREKYANAKVTLLNPIQSTLPNKIEESGLKEGEVK